MMKKYINPVIEVTPINAMLALCYGSDQGTQPGGAGHAPKHRDVF